MVPLDVSKVADSTDDAKVAPTPGVASTAVVKLLSCLLYTSDAADD